MGEFVAKLEFCAFFKDYTNCFAFFHKFTVANPEVDGWNIYNDIKEYERMGLDLYNEVLLL